MATEGILNGTLIGLYVDGTLIASAKSHSLSVSLAMREATDKDSAGWEESLPGLKNWGISIDALYADDDTKGMADLFTALTGRSSVAVKFSTEVTGDDKFSGTAYIESLELNAPVEESCNYSCSLKGTGALTKAAVT